MKLLALVGPTAGGKTQMSIEVARAIGNVEIVSCDSMAVYKGFDIAADKPTTDQRGDVPHHLFDIVEPSEGFTAVKYRDRARAAISDIAARGATPMLVGGSGLYFRAVVDELAFAPTSPEVRSRLEAEDPAALLARIREADPASAARLDPRNVRRIVRAAEILELTGQPPTELRGDWEKREGLYDLSVVALTWDRPLLLERAERRVHVELEAGLVEEVACALQRGISDTAMQALGVKEIVEHVQGRMTLEEATTRLVRNTKRFVRRQISWFKADPRVEWIDASELGWDGAREAIVKRFSA